MVSAEARADFPATLFFHQASVEAGEAFFRKRALTARSVSDPDGLLFDAFGMRRGGWFELLGPAVWWRGLRAMTKGFFVGCPRSDPRRMSGLILVRGNSIEWRYHARHSGDHPNLADVPPVPESSNTESS